MNRNPWDPEPLWWWRVKIIALVAIPLVVAVLTRTKVAEYR
jgi:hypothetical protein